jgi:predicted secreted acid phosphatase
MKSGSKKCNYCGTMASSPYKYTIVPSRKYGQFTDTYVKGAQKTNREDLKGDKKVTIKHYCNEVCCEKDSPTLSERTYSF